jgi:hypothetical protein
LRQPHGSAVSEEPIRFEKVPLFVHGPNLEKSAKKGPETGNLTFPSPFDEQIRLILKADAISHAHRPGAAACILCVHHFDGFHRRNIH